MTDHPEPAPSVADQLRELARQLELTDPHAQALKITLEVTDGERTWKITRTTYRRTL